MDILLPSIGSNIFFINRKFEMFCSVFWFERESSMTFLPLFFSFTFKGTVKRDISSEFIMNGLHLMTNALTQYSNNFEFDFELENKFKFCIDSVI